MPACLGTALPVFWMPDFAALLRFRADVRAKEEECCYAARLPHHTTPLHAHYLPSHLMPSLLVGSVALQTSWLTFSFHFPRLKPLCLHTTTAPHARTQACVYKPADDDTLYSTAVITNTSYGWLRFGYLDDLLVVSILSPTPQLCRFAFLDGHLRFYPTYYHRLRILFISHFALHTSTFKVPYVLAVRILPSCLWFYLFHVRWLGYVRSPCVPSSRWFDRFPLRYSQYIVPVQDLCELPGTGLLCRLRFPLHPVPTLLRH